MRFIKPLIYSFLFVLVLSTLGGSGYAKNKYKMKYSGLDRNHDGEVTRTEWRGNDQSFQNHDWNGDGVLSGDEVRTGTYRDENDDRNRNNDATFANLDYNRNNTISRNEWRGDLGSFDRRDCNQDSLLTRDEFFSFTECNTTVGAGAFGNLDNNNDGYIYRNEWRDSSQAFLNKDCNRDDRVSRNEYLAQTCSSSACDADCLFRELDVNNDGLIYRTEWQGNTQGFNQLDQNGDNRLTRNEFYYINQNIQGKTQQMLGSVAEIINSIFRQ